MSGVLTVGITTRHRPEALLACLRSIAILRHLDPEVLVFDDASSPPALDQVRQTDVRARVIRDESAPGNIVGRNRLVREAVSEFVLLLDDDARILTSQAIESALEVMRADPRVGAIAFAQAEADGRPWPIQMQPSKAQQSAVIPAFIGFAHLLRRSVFLDLSGYRERFEFYGEEKEFCLRLLHAGFSTVYLPDALVAHVIHQGNRDRRRYLRFVARNDCLNTIYNDPIARLCWMLPARFALYFRMRHRWQTEDPGGGLWLFRELVRQLPDAWRARRPVSRATLRRWRMLAANVIPYAVPVAGRGIDGG